MVAARARRRDARALTHGHRAPTRPARARVRRQYRDAVAPVDQRPDTDERGRADCARWRCAGGGGDGARRVRAAGARRERRAGADHRHALAARVVAQDAHTAGGARGSPASVARLRSRPAHAVQARGALLRCGHRRSRRCAQHAARRPRRGPARTGRHGSAASRKLRRPRDQRHRRRAGDRRGVANQPAARRPASAGFWSRAVADRFAGSAPRRRCARGAAAADLAQARRSDRADPDVGCRAPARVGVGRAAHRARASHQRLQLRARSQVRVPRRAASARRRHAHPARRHVAHTARAPYDARQGCAARDDASRRIGQRRATRCAARGLEALHAGSAALADDEDPAGARRNLRCKRPLGAAAAAHGDAARPDSADRPQPAGDCGGFAQPAGVERAGRARGLPYPALALPLRRAQNQPPRPLRIRPHRPAAASAPPGAAVPPTAAPAASTRRAAIPGSAAPARPAVPAEEAAEPAAPAPAAESNDGFGPRPEESQ